MAVDFEALDLVRSPLQLDHGPAAGAQGAGLQF